MPFMERISQNPEIYSEVTRQDFAVLVLNAIYYVAGRAVLADDLAIALQNEWGVIGNGIHFERQYQDGKSTFGIEVSKGERRATVFLDEDSQTAKVVRKDNINPLSQTSPLAPNFGA